MPVFEIICLANSRKHGGRCVAGLRTDGQGWLRPVGSSEDGTLSPEHYTLRPSGEVRIFDRLLVGCLKPQPEPHQPENWVIDGTPWKLGDPLTPPELAKIIQPHFVQGPALLGSESDRIPFASFSDRPVPTSLALVLPEHLQWKIATARTGGRRLRSLFTLGGADYDLAVTDPVWEQRLEKLSEGTFPAGAVGLKAEDRILLTVSLGEPFLKDNCCYKLIAAVTILPPSLRSILVRSAKMEDKEKKSSAAGEEDFEAGHAVEAGEAEPAELDEIAGLEAEAELKRDLAKVMVREYQHMASDLRWEVLDYLDANPDEPLLEVARRFGVKEGSIRAWKAHQTMGTYRRQNERKKDRIRRNQEPLFKSPSAKQGPRYLERKRYSNFIHFFDKTPEGIVCPHFFILAHANGCPYECQYCYLNLTLRHYPEPTVFSNTARMFQEVREWLLAEDKPAVLNCGELSDGLAWDDSTELSRNLVPLFAGQKRHKLLFLTKSTNVTSLLEMEPTPRVIVSFSLNAEEVARRFEKKSPPPLKRLEAARRLRERGWDVRLRLDPIIPIENWAVHYRPIAEAINAVAPEVVTLGTLRFFKTLPNFARFGNEVFRYGEDFQDPDGRLRLAPELRLSIYRFLMDILTCSKIGLCKETAEIHEKLGLAGEKQSCNCTLD